MTAATHIKTLGVAPSTRGLGYAVMDGAATLLDWGVKVSKGGGKNQRCLSHLARLVETCQPDLLALPDTRGSRRGPRVKLLIGEMEAMAAEAGIRVVRLSRKAVHREALQSEGATKQAVAKFLADAYPSELSFRLPQKRRIWAAESYQMDMFDAVALARHAAKGVQ